MQVKIFERDFANGCGPFPVLAVLSRCHGVRRAKGNVSRVRYKGLWEPCSQEQQRNVPGLSREESLAKAAEKGLSLGFRVVGTG